MKIRNKWMLLLLATALIMTVFSGCAGENASVDTEEPVSTGDGTYEVQTTDGNAVSGSDGKFTIQYDPEQSLNPLTGTNHYNMTAAGLIYEGLYRLDENFQPIPVLCESCTTKDGLTYDIKIQSNIVMHDGSTLTASDVVYSLVCARDTEKYRSRFDRVASVTATGDQTLQVVLTVANDHFEALLDVPVIQSGTLGDTVPVGCGPYVYSDGHLVAFEQYRDYDKLPVDTIYLEQFSSFDVVESFGNQTLDLIHTDPASNDRVNIAINHNTKSYDTTVLQYVGFNMNHTVLAEQAVRQAISQVTDREEIAERVMGGYAVPAPLIISSRWYLYDESWESSIYVPQKDAAALLSSAKLKDTNKDGYLEYQTASGYQALTLDFVVNNDNSYQVAAAQCIVDALAGVGLNVQLRKLSWEEYVYAVTTGDFDLYYAEVRLTADFDLTELLGVDGSLNYGGITTAEYDTLIQAFLGAKDDAAIQTAGKNLCRQVSENVPVLPILYKENAVYTYNGVVSGMRPTQTGVFSNIADWTLQLQPVA